MSRDGLRSVILGEVRSVGGRKRDLGIKIIIKYELITNSCFATHDVNGSLDDWPNFLSRSAAASAATAAAPAAAAAASSLPSSASMNCEAISS